MKFYALIALALVAVAVALPQDSLEEIVDEQLTGGGDDPSCTETADCATQKFGKLCLDINPQNGRGKCRCLEASDCASGETCDLSGNSGSGKCKAGGGGGGNNPKCTVATEDDDCTNPSKPYCLVAADPKDNKCVECNAAHPCTGGKTCNANNVCVGTTPAPKCTVATQATDCKTDNKLYCLVAADPKDNKCVECTATPQCGAGKTCSASNVCVPVIPAPIPCGAYDKCPTGRFCKRANGAKSCVEGCKVKHSVCKTIDNKTGKCNSANKCIVPAKTRGSPCSTKIVNDCGTGFKCVASYKKSYKGACHKVVAAGASCGKGKFPDLCPTGSKCKYHKCTIPVVVAIP